uniref:Uncharacterized protein n=1 Tax=Rhizophora mucronata TaxID=61149 RepID=A0A2P2QRK1_RHIMU
MLFLIVATHEVENRYSIKINPYSILSAIVLARPQLWRE